MVENEVRGEPGHREPVGPGEPFPWILFYLYQEAHGEF